MELARAIFDWSEKQPLWRRDLMCRLAVAPAIDAGEQERLLAAVIASVGGPPAEIELQPLALLDLPRVAVEPLQLVRLSNVVNVNGLAREQEIVFAPRLNVLYGGTGAGKTGYPHPSSV